MTEVTQEEKAYVIELIEDGSIKAVNNLEGATIFAVSSEFEDEQIDVIYKIADGFFQQGAKFGITRIQNDMKAILGLVEEDSE